MRHYSEKDIIDYVYMELNSEKMDTIKQHLITCKSCSEVALTYSEINSSLGFIREEIPSDTSFNSIMSSIEAETVQEKNAWERFFILSSVLIVLAFLYTFSNLILSFPFLHELNKFELFHSLSNLSKTLVIFFGIGTALTLAITPILIKENQLQEVKLT